MKDRRRDRADEVLRQKKLAACGRGRKTMKEMARRAQMANAQKVVGVLE